MPGAIKLLNLIKTMAICEGFSFLFSFHVHVCATLIKHCAQNTFFRPTVGLQTSSTL